MSKPSHNENNFESEFEDLKLEIEQKLNWEREEKQIKLERQLKEFESEMRRQIIGNLEQDLSA